MKIYVIGSSIGYARWMLDVLNATLTDKMEDSDLVVLTGGADIDPMFYGENKGKYTSTYAQRDDYEFAEINKAIDLNKKIVGICRGMQWLTIINGGKLIQHINHPGSHKIKLYNNNEVIVNSMHHQMCFPYDITTKYKILGFTDNISNVHLNGDNKNVELPNNFVEPEIILFNDNHLGYQYHPEAMSMNSEGMQATVDIFLKFMNNKLVEEVYE
jgi:putative glutamine amidotransferase